RTGVTQSVVGTGAEGMTASGSGRLIVWLAALGMALASSGCLLTKDLPDPALDIPTGYKAAGTRNALDAPPKLDWWRGFRSAELTTLMEEAQTVNLDIAAATARFKQADAQARVTGAALVPPLRQTLQQNINALATLVSRPPESLRVTGGSMNQIVPPRVTPGLPSELLTQRPDIRRQEAQLASATANVGSARAQFFPSIQL